MTLRYEPFDADASSVAEQRRLFLQCFPENIGLPAAEEAHYRWKFKGFPDPRPAYEFCAREGAEIVGYYAGIPFPYSISGQAHRAAMICDVMTSPAMRGRGVFTELGRYATDRLGSEGIAFTTGYPIRPEVIPGHLKVGWKIAFQLPMYIQVLKTKALLKRLALQTLAPLVDVFFKTMLVVAGLFAPRSQRYKVSTTSSDAFLSRPDVETFLKQWRDVHRNALIKTVPFLRWRLAAPGVEYQVITATLDGKLVAAAIVRSAVLQGVPCLAVLDQMVLPGHVRAVRSLNLEQRQLARSLKCEAVVTMMSLHQARQQGLMRLGFIRSPAVFSLIIKTLDPALDTATLFAEENWQLMWIDSDDL